MSKPLTRSELVEVLNQLPDLPVIFPVRNSDGSWSLHPITDADVRTTTPPAPSGPDSKSIILS